MGERETSIIFSPVHAKQFEMEQKKEDYLKELKELTGKDFQGDFDEHGRFNVTEINNE